MLIRFGVQNHRSIAAKQELSLSVSTLRDDRTGLINCPSAPGGWVLPAIVIYGANASGKSNIVSALRTMRSMILYSHSRGEPGGEIMRAPFALDPRTANATTMFDADFVVGGVRHHYGFEASDDAFIAEWLYSFPNDRRQMLFIRDGMNFEFGRSLKGHNKIISELTRTNSLFLSCAVQNAHDDLVKVSQFFRDLDIHGAGVNYLQLRELGDNDIDRRVIDFLRATSTGVSDYTTQEVTPSAGTQEFIQGLGQVVNKFIGDQLTPDMITEGLKPRRILKLGHRNAGGDLIYFDLEDESTGTRRLLLLLNSVFRSLDSGTTMIVDELNASLHTRACEAILELFSSPKSNRHGAQLIATTHDTNLLHCPGLRRDQVWFTEKSIDGATQLFPLTDIRTRKGDNIERGYLQGRYGAIPFSGTLADLSLAD